MSVLDALFTAFDRYLAAGVRKTRAVRKANAVVDFQGIAIELDRPKGFVQEGTDPQGNAWRRVYRFDYGFIPKTDGGDGEDLDVFLGPTPSAPTAFLAVQVNDAGAFDEFKVFLGFATEALAQACYRMHIPARFLAGWLPLPVAFVQSLLGLEPSAVIKAVRKASEERMKKIAKNGLSFEQVTSMLSAALRAALPQPPPGDCSAPCSVDGPWIQDVYADAVVFNYNGLIYAATYAITADMAGVDLGQPIEVVRTYAPAGAPPATADAQVAMRGTQKAAIVPTDKRGETMPVNTKKKSEANMGAKVKKAGGGDIVQLAAERLADIAKGLGKGDGMITAEVKAGLDAVVALLQTATDLYTGGASAGADDGDGQDDETDPADQAQDTADQITAAEKSGGVVKMTAPTFLEYAVGQIVKARAETNPVRKAARMAALDSMLGYARTLMKSAQFEGATPPAFPVVIVPMENDQTETTIQPSSAAPSNFGPAATGGSTSPSGVTAPANGIGGTASFTEKVADVQKAISGLRGKLPNAGANGANTPVAKGTPAAPVAKGTPGGEPGLWPASYVDNLPDASFLYVEPNAVKTANGLTSPEFRHFAVKDADGKLSKMQLSHAMKRIPFFGATPEFKAELLKRAEGLFGIETSLEKSAQDAAGRGDDGWPADMADPDFLAGRKPHKATSVFGFDGIHDKIRAHIGGGK